MDDKRWFSKREKAGKFWLDITAFLVRYAPSCILRIAVFFVVFVFYIFCKDERKNIATFRHNLASKFKDERLKRGVFSNFYHFGLSICDKFGVYKGQIDFNRLNFLNKELLLGELVGVKKGKIILCAHFGNVEVLRAFARQNENFKMVILAYNENSKAFSEAMSKVSGDRLEFICVNELDVGVMSELARLVNSGTHIAIMGDRTPLSSARVQRLEFLGQQAYFSEGAYLIAGLLGAEIGSLWCYRVGDKFNVEYEAIACEIKLTRDRSQSIKPFMMKFISVLEQKVRFNSSEWFNFFDFWGDYGRN